MKKQTAKELRKELLNAVHLGLVENLKANKRILGKVKAYEVLMPSDTEISLRVRLPGENKWHYFTASIRASKWSSE